MLKNALSAKAVANLKSGKHRDGEGLQFEVKGGSRRWTFSFTFEGRQRELAIGKYPAMSLAEARAKRAELRDAKNRGVDPRSVLNSCPNAAKPITLRQDMNTYVAHMQGQWTPLHRTYWVQSMERIAAPLMDTPTAALTQADVLDVIQPVWETTNETARRVLGRIEQTIEHAMAIDAGRFNGMANPCNNILKVLPRVSVIVRPRPAMPWRELPAFFAQLRQRPETAARALELLLLTCCPRTGEVIPATWGEIDGNRWNVPAGHMKSGVARTIPLSDAAVALLNSIRPAQATPDALIFGSSRRGGSGRQTDQAMQVLMREKMGLEYTVHGFRSSFMDWVAEVHPQRLLEAERALDHQIGTQVQRAYLRTDFLEQRRELAELWALHLTSGTHLAREGVQQPFSRPYPPS
ncbi:MAG TPA: integrase arm-type DNA-binding domain-containing protein [Acetobacteraceae bacterium]|nr:integrase arm-type DNA-binding domain-containing protein [Acetobacteraceae bacterium]